MKKYNKTRVVLVGGCFDILHFGHIEFLRQAKALGDQLIVALESDENVRKRKGELRPIHTQDQRAQMLRALTVVNEVILLAPTTSDNDYQRLVEEISPDIISITQGDPYKSHKQKQAESIGAIVVEIPKIYTPSTSQLAKLIGLE